MKRTLSLLFTLLLCAVGCVNEDRIWQSINSLEERVAKLETLCDKYNNSISAIQTILNKLQSHDYVTSVRPITSNGEVIGYEIVFSDSGVVAIYHGEDGKDGVDGVDGTDGKDGVDGKDGKDGYTPTIDVRKDIDGVYYWTLDGEWLLDDEGNKLRVEGRDGKDGADGADGSDGKDGVDGTDGKDGYTPTIGVRRDTDGNYYWTLDGEWLLDDEGNKMRVEGRDGEDGKDGVDGEDGKDGSDGKDGEDGIDGDTPIIGVRLGSDGHYYWTLNGNWLLDEDGNRVAADCNCGLDGTDGKDGQDGKDGEDGKDGQDGVDGKDGKDGVTPRLKIEDDYWYISYDEGATWSKLQRAVGEDGDSYFNSVTQDDASVYLELADGTVITLPKAQELSVTFDEDENLQMMANDTHDIWYNIVSSSARIDVEFMASGDINVELIEQGDKSGIIRITTGEAIMPNSKVLLFISDYERVIMRSFHIYELGLCAEAGDADIAVEDVGGEVVLNFMSNITYRVIIPDEAASWIAPVEATRSLKPQSIALTISENMGEERTAVVEVKAEYYPIAIAFTIRQAAISEASILRHKREAERAALLDLYEKYIGAQWPGYDSWATEAEVSQWEGVTVDADGLVTALDISGLDIVGELPMQVAELSQLRSLDLSDNSFTGGIPEAYVAMDLESIALDGNYLQGDIPQAWIADAEFMIRNYRGLIAQRGGNMGIVLPAFEFESLDGQIIDNSYIADHSYTILYTFDLSSDEARDFAQYRLTSYYNSYAADGLGILSYSLADDDSMLSFVQQRGITWPVSTCRNTDQLDSMGAFWGNADFAFARVCVVDSEGRMLFGDYYGSNYSTDLGRLIESLLR